jgi:hypothetical protein
MKTWVPVVSVLALALAMPVAAQEKGRGEGKGRGYSEARGRPEPREMRGPERRIEREIERRVEREIRPDVGDVRRVERDVVRAVAGNRAVIVGCPPGLARKDNGCLPPGQARKIARDYSRYDYLWDRRNDDYRYRYDDGYLYRTSSSGSLLGYLPLLGGALTTGAVWPNQYEYQAPSAYFSDYYDLSDRYNYRYADGVLYGVDPQTQAIGQVAALLTGQQWNVGQAMPSGYDIYNVPYQYRDRYADTPERMYRYNDGYVYQVDPTTQLVQAVIQLLT